MAIRAPAYDLIMTLFTNDCVWSEQAADRSPVITNPIRALNIGMVPLIYVPLELAINVFGQLESG